MSKVIGNIITKAASSILKTGGCRAQSVESSLLRFAENPVSHPSFLRKSVTVQRPVFNETTEAYVDLIKNNRQELQCMTRRYYSKPDPSVAEEEFAEEFMLFLKKKMNMPYTPEIKIFSSETLAGGMDNLNGILYYNTRHMTRLSELPSTLMHETHHFLQQKEIFSIMSIEEFSRLKARKDMLELIRENPAKYKSLSAKQIALAEQTEACMRAREYKAAGWEDVMQHYPKITDPTSASYKRAKELLDADLNYSGSGSRYFSNLQEKEAFDISVRTQWEFEHSIVGEITASEKHIANEIYSTLTSETFSEVPRAQELVQAINVTPQNLIDVIRQASSRGISNPDNIIELIF